MNPFRINAGYVQTGQEVVMYCRDVAYPIIEVARECGYFTVPINCYRAYVDGKLVIDFDLNEFEKKDL